MISRMLLPALTLAAVTLASCSLNQPTSMTMPWDKPAGSPSSEAAASSSFSLPPESAEPTFADEMVTETGSEVTSAPLTVSGALLERVASGGILEIGLPSAPLLTVYTHPSCAYCREFHENHLERILREYVAHGQLRLQILIVPFAKYPATALQSSAVLCAAKTGGGLKMLGALVDNPEFSQTVMNRVIKDWSLPASFAACQKSPETAALQKALTERFTRDGITLVPTFTLNGYTQTGLPRYADFRGWIEARLNRR